MANINELQLPDGTIKVIEDGTLWSGHRADWEALTAEEKSKYRYVMFDDDSETGETVDAVTDGDMRAVTSNAVFEKTTYRTVATAVADGTKTYADMINEMGVAFNSLTTEERKDALIVSGNVIYRSGHLTQFWFSIQDINTSQDIELLSMRKTANNTFFRRVKISNSGTIVSEDIGGNVSPSDFVLMTRG